MKQLNNVLVGAQSAAASIVAVIIVIFLTNTLTFSVQYCSTIMAVPVSQAISDQNYLQFITEFQLPTAE